MSRPNTAGNSPVDRSLRSIRIGRLSSKKDRACHGLGQLLGHVAHSCWREAVSAACEWIVAPIVMVCCNEQITEATRLYVENNAQRANSLAQDRAGLFLG